MIRKYQRYSDTLKRSVLQKVLSGGKSVASVCEEHGLAVSTCYKWIHQNQKGKPGVMKKKNRQKRSMSEKLTAIKVTASMTPEATAAWCREQGIYVHEIAQWENEISNGLSDSSKSTPSSVKHEMAILRAENKALKKDLHRKDRVLPVSMRERY